MINQENEKNKEEKWPQKSLRKRPLPLILILSFVISTFSGAAFGFLSAGLYNFISIEEKAKGTENKNEVSQTIQQNLIQEDIAVTEAVEKATTAVVSIVVTQDVPKFKRFFNNPFEDFFFFDPFDWPQRQQPEFEKKKVGGGSGFLISPDGLIVTNKHVVESANAEYTVVLNDGKEFSARVLGRHPNLDVAIIKIEGKNFPVLELGDSQNLKVGQTVIAIGYSLGEFANSVSKGIVSGLKRNIVASSSLGQTEKLTDIIQTDAAINPGNSGGPLLDINGKVVGVNVAIVQGAQNIGFALPINQVKKVIESVQKEGRISVPYLGVRYILINENLQKENNLPFNYGALIVRGEKITDLAVIPGSPADKAGLKENDIILEINGQKIDQDRDLSQRIASLEVGETVELKIWRKGKTEEVRLTLEERRNF